MGRFERGGRLTIGGLTSSKLIHFSFRNVFISLISRCFAPVGAAARDIVVVVTVERCTNRVCRPWRVGEGKRTQFVGGTSTEEVHD